MAEEAKITSKSKNVKSKKGQIKEAELIVEAAPLDKVESTAQNLDKKSKKSSADETSDSELEQEGMSAAKAGKRSAKGQAEAEAKAVKIEQQKHRDDTKLPDEVEAKPKKIVKPARTRLERRGKKFRDATKLIDSGKEYSLAQAVELAKKSSPAKFDASVELHINLNVDPRHADQNIRDNVALPAGSGKKVRVAVYDDEKIADADTTGVDAITKLLEKGEINFDVLIATPAQMPKLGKYARILGPRGLMPNPKSGTVTTDLAKAVKAAKSGKVEYRVDSTGIVHINVGKVSFSTEQLIENVQAVFLSIKANKPGSVKGNFIKTIFISTTMGPSVKLAISEI
jgi:large subunit ribosomal protein L1